MLNKGTTLVHQYLMIYLAWILIVWQNWMTTCCPLLYPPPLSESGVNHRDKECSVLFSKLFWSGHITIENRLHFPRAWTESYHFFVPHTSNSTLSSCWTNLLDNLVSSWNLINSTNVLRQSTLRKYPLLSSYSSPFERTFLMLCWNWKTDILIHRCVLTEA